MSVSLEPHLLQSFAEWAAKLTPTAMPNRYHWQRRRHCLQHRIAGGAGRVVSNRIICQAFTSGSDRLLQLLCWPKGDLLAGGYLHCLSSRWIASCARLTLANLKRSKATDPDAVSLLQVPCHAKRQLTRAAILIFLTDVGQSVNTLATVHPCAAATLLSWLICSFAVRGQSGLDRA